MDRLPDRLESNGRVEVRVDGVVVGTRRIIDFVSSGGNADDGGLDDKVSVDMSAFATPSTELWELDGSDDLHPLADPTTFTVNVYETITFDSGSGESTFSMNDSGQMSLFGNDYVIVQGANETIIGVSSAGYDDSVMPNGSLLFAPNEGLSTLTIVWKYTDGTVKTFALGPFA